MQSKAGLMAGPLPDGNLLLGALPERERERFLAHCRPVDLTLAEVLCASGDPIRNAYFPLRSCISLGARVPGHAALDVSLIGNEGMVGIALLLGLEVSAQVAVVRSAGAALCMEAAPFLQQLSACPALTRILMRYTHLRMSELARNVACTRFHVVEARLARLLLMTQDRLVAGSMHLTHEALADRLGVRRAGVTIAASALQRDALISYHRGEVRVLDRTGLERAACSCYAADTQAYGTIMGRKSSGVVEASPWPRSEAR